MTPYAGAHAVIFDAGRHRGMKAARDACLSALVDHAAKIGAARLVLERDESVLKADQRLLFERVRHAGVAASLRYEHLRAHEECRLAIPDALAWCWARGGTWRSTVRGLVTEVREV